MCLLGICPPPLWPPNILNLAPPPNILNLPTPMYHYPEIDLRMYSVHLYYLQNYLFQRNCAYLDYISRNTGIGCWLVGCFGFRGPLRQYCSLYRTASQRERERERERPRERETEREREREREKTEKKVESHAQNITTSHLEVYRTNSMYWDR